MEAGVWVSVAVLLCCLLAGAGGDRLTCYVCNTMEDGRDCNDYFVANNPNINKVSGCSACKKQKTYIGGQQYIKRECDHAVRYLLRWECKQSTVFSTPGDECYCLKDLCNAAPSSGRAWHVTVTVTAAAMALLGGASAAGSSLVACL